MATKTRKKPAAKTTHVKTVSQSGKGTIRFLADKPLPYRLVTKIVKARIAKIEKSG